MKLLVHHYIENSALQYPSKTALIHEDRRCTYPELNAMANSLAFWIIDQGIKKGDRVAIFMENSCEYVASYYGVLKSGAIAVPLSHDLKPDGLKPIIDEVEPKIIFASTRFERILKASQLHESQSMQLIISKPKLDWSGSKGAVTLWDDVVKNGIIENPNEDALNEDDIASIIFTSGSTGVPKGVMLSHKNICSNTRSICEYLELSAQDIQMVVLPFYYVMGKSLLNTHFAVGGTVVINNKFAYPAAVIKQMEDEKVTGFSGVPSTFAYLLHRSPLKKHKGLLTSLRYCSQAGGHMSNQIKRELRRVLPEHVKIYIMYGATEASARLAYLAPEYFESKMGSIGRSIPDVTLKVLDSRNREVDVGETGELTASGPNIMRGYWNDPASTNQVLDHNGYHTGDLGYQDQDGFFFVTGRKDNLLKVGGHRINPIEIEEALMSTDLFIEVSVFGLSDALLGNKLVAVGVPFESDCTEMAVFNKISQLLPKYKLPSEIRFIKTLPKSSSGKVDNSKCMALFG